MARKFDGGKLVIATHNSGKVVEIADLLAPFGADLVSAGELGLPEPEETGSSFIANAELKALAATKGSGFPALADDSGLVVPTLGGDPGIYSARWAGPSKNFQSAMRKVEDGLRGEKDRTARFVSALTLAWPDGHTVSVEGTVRGELTWPPGATEGSVTTRSSCRWATTSPLGRWIRLKNIKLAIERMHSESWSICA